MNTKTQYEEWKKEPKSLPACTNRFQLLIDLFKTVNGSDGQGGSREQFVPLIVEYASITHGRYTKNGMTEAGATEAVRAMLQSSEILKEVETPLLSPPDDSDDSDDG